MSTRVRFIYEKRAGACFVPHVALSSVFSRAALRSGLNLSLTQGFSPRAKISFGPELPAGVVALAEPVDMFFEDIPENLLELFNSAMPEGFNLNKILFPKDDSPSLGKVCKAALYFVKYSMSTEPCDLLLTAHEYYDRAVIKAELKDEWLLLTLNDPAQNGIGGWIKKMIHDEKINGWQDVNIVRAAIGQWNGEKVSIDA